MMMMTMTMKNDDANFNDYNDTNNINGNNNQEHLADAPWLILFKIALGKSILIDNLLFITIVPFIANRTKCQGVVIGN